ncbi:MAG: SAM-dependent chlorinase/fluorinase [Planctomycetes bacterium]|nr:SAM-dependent chlorinase/fluorinase [Planctomycetota bacterium]MCC7172663.1 SAM-dependent chlorinase/fluorinase [Planctomycetota bacterium]
MKLSGIVTLLTDFGEHDPYVGVVKGVILGIHPAARLVDLTHQVAPQRVLEANFQLRGAWEFFPAGTIHVCVVDPGVGSTRRILCARTRGHVFLAPDNGLLTGVLGAGDDVRAVTNTRWFRGGELSHTFHGRDIFAPVAARLLEGLEFTDVGPVVTDPKALELPLPTRGASGVVRGEVIHVDSFGNLITNVRPQDLAHLPEERRVVRLGSRVIGKPVDSYATAARGNALAIFDSFEYLEIAVNCGNAERTLVSGLGASVSVGE